MQFLVSEGCCPLGGDLGRSVEYTALISRDHVLDVDESIVASVHLEELERLLDQIAEVLLLALGVIDAVTHVEVVRLEQVHDGKDLTVIRHESFTDGITALDEGLEHMERRADDLVITSVQSR